MSATPLQRLLNPLSAINGPHPPPPLSLLLIQRVKYFLSYLIPRIKLSVFPLHPVSNQLNGAHNMLLISVYMWSPLEVICLAVQVQHFFTSLSFLCKYE